MKFLNKLFRRRQTAYVQTFSGPNAEVVLADLKRFCRATVPTADLTNPNATYLMEGRREVWLRIVSHLNLTDEEVSQLVENYTENDE